MPHLALFFVALSPGTVVFGCKVAFKRWENPQDLRPIRQDPTHPLSLLLIGGVVILILSRLYAWRDANDTRIAARVNTAEIAQIGAQSLAAKRYLNDYARKYKRTDIAISHLLRICGFALRLAGQTSSIDSSPTIKACSQLSAIQKNGLGFFEPVVRQASGQREGEASTTPSRKFKQQFAPPQSLRADYTARLSRDHV